MKIICANRKECPEGRWCKNGAERGCSKFVPKKKIDWNEIMSSKKEGG